MIKKLQKKTKTSILRYFITALAIFSSIKIIAQQTINGTITHNDVERSYILYIPASYTSTTAVPLLFNFHGYTSNASEQMVYGDFRSIADTEGFIIIHPEGLVDNVGNTHFNVGWGTSSIDDVAFTEALITEITTNYTIDTEKIYSTGFSNGGFMSYKLACDASDKFAAVASVGGSRTSFQSCGASHQIPVMQIHGTADETVTYNGSTFGFEAIDDVIDFCVDFNNCNENPTVTMVENSNTTDNSTVEHSVYSAGDNGAEVELYKVIDGGHTWPGSIIPLAGKVTNYDINASEKVWEFLSKYDINGKIDVLSNDEFTYTTNFDLYPNPVDSSLYIDVANRNEVTYKMLSLGGQLLSEGKISTIDNSINMESLAHGIYVLKVDNKIFKIIKN